MALNENSGAVITLDEAQKLISEFSKQYPNEVKSFFIGANHYKAILDQEDCIGIRIYNGYDPAAGQMSTVLVGVDSKENDLKNGVILDKAVTCPPNCPSGVVLTD